jgi:hypothetical protein
MRSAGGWYYLGVYAAAQRRMIRIEAKLAALSQACRSEPSLSL